MERKLAAILSADVAGYSQLVEDDDEATIATLMRYRELMRVSIEAHHGRVVDTPGDNLLAEFGSVVDAVRSAVEMQRLLRTENEQIKTHRRMEFRMGINVGDVVVEGTHVYGNGVNIAARLEALADPGGIYLSGNAIEQVEDKVDVGFEFVGEQDVKNISKTISIWRAILDDDSEATAGPAVSDTRQTRAAKFRKSRVSKALVYGIGICVVIAVVAVLRKPAAPIVEVSESSTPPAVPAEINAPTTISERPAIIVLPFVNMSDDPEQEYFSDGFTEDITTDLSKLDSIFVVSSNAASQYKGQRVEPKTLKEEHGVRYFLDGSVRKVGDKLRISARLNDVAADQYIWAERYDRPVTEVFAVQDEIRGKILTALRVNLTEEEQRRFSRAPTKNLEAYDFYLRGREMSQRARRELRPELMNEAVKLFEQAITLDSEYAAAYGGLGLVYWLKWRYNWDDDGDVAIHKALRLFEKTRALGEKNPHFVAYRIIAQLRNRQFDEAMNAARTYLELRPQDPQPHYMLGFVQTYSGEFKDALDSLTRSKNLYPRRIPPYAYWIYGMVYSLLDRDDEALVILKEGTLRAPNYLTNQIVLAIANSKLGNDAEAQAAVKEILRISPAYDAERFRKWNEFKDPAITEGFVTVLRKAGLP